MIYYVYCVYIYILLLAGSRIPFERINESESEASGQSAVLSGGRWVPRWCVPRQRVAIIVPFRDRESHLGVFLNVLHPFLQRQLVDYTIFVVEQVIPILQFIVEHLFLSLATKKRKTIFIYSLSINILKRML